MGDIALKGGLPMGEAAALGTPEELGGAAVLAGGSGGDRGDGDKRSREESDSGEAHDVVGGWGAREREEKEREETWRRSGLAGICRATSRLD